MTQPAVPALLPLSFSAQDPNFGHAWQALQWVADLEQTTADVLTAATALNQHGRLRSRVAAAPDLARAAGEMVSYTSEHQGRLQVSLDEAYARVKDAKPSWWLMSGPQLTTVDDIEAAGQWLAGDGPDRLRDAVQHLESVVPEVASAANQTAERLERLVRRANELLPDTGAEQATLGLQLYKARGIPAGTQFTAPRWPEPRPSERHWTAAEAAAAAAEIEVVAREHAALRPEDLEDAVRSVLAAAITDLQIRLATAGSLSTRLNALPETARKEQSLQWNVAAIHQNTVVTAGQLHWLGQPHTAREMDAAVRELDEAIFDYQEVEAALRGTIAVVLDEPIRMAGAAAGLAKQMDGLLPHVGEQPRNELLQQRRVWTELPNSSVVLEPVASRPLAEWDKALSEGLARLRDLSPVMPDFTAALPPMLQAGWQSFTNDMTDLLGQARRLLEETGGRLADGRRHDLNAELGKAERKLSGQRPELPESPGVDELEAARQALTRVAAAQAPVGQVIGEVNAKLAEHTAAALGRRRALHDALHQAEWAAPGVDELPPRPPSAAERIEFTLAIEAARERQAWLSRLEDETSALFDAAIAEADDLRQRVEDAEHLASDAQALLAHVGGERASLSGQLDQAAGNLRKIRPNWWRASGTDLTTVEEVDAVRQTLDPGLPERLERAAEDIGRTVADLIAAVDDDEWAQKVRDLQGAASQTQDLLRDVLPTVGWRPTALATAIEEPLARLGHLDHDAPIQEQLAPVVELEAAIRRATDAAVATSRQRAAALVNLIPQVRGLLPLTPGRLDADLTAARQAVGYLLNPPAQPQTTGDPVGAAREARDAVAVLRAAISAVLTEAATQLPDWADDAGALLAAIQRPGPLTREQRSDLDALIRHFENPPENDITRLDPGIVRRGMIAVTALIAATSRELNPAVLRQRARSAIDLAEAVAGLPGTGGEQDSQDADAGLDVVAVRDVMEGLPERRLGRAEADAFRRTVDAVARLETATKDVISTATAELDGLWPQVEDAEIVAGATRVLLPHTGPLEAGLTTTLDRVVEELRQRRPGWWPADGADLTTVAELREVTQTLESDASRQLEAALDAVIQVAAEVVAEASRVLRERARSAVELARAARALLPHTGDEAALTSVLDEATARGRRFEAQDPHDGTLAGVRAAGRDLERVAAVEADVTRVISRAADGLRQRVANAPALARSARALSARIGPRATLNADLDEATLPDPNALPTGPRWTVPEVDVAARALDRVTRVEVASRDLLTSAVGRLEAVRGRYVTAIRRAAAARSLLRYGGPRQDSLTARLDAAARAVPDEAALVGAWPSAPGMDRVTQADLEAADRALASQVRALGSANRSLDLAANEVFATAPDRWRQWRLQAQALRSEVSRLFPGQDERPAELRNAFAQHAAVLAQAETEVPGALGNLDQIVSRTTGIAAAFSPMTRLGDANERLNIALRATTRGRADILLGDGHPFTLDQLTTAMTLAEEFVPVGQRTQADEENFSWLARQIGLHNQDGLSGTVRRMADRSVMAQLFALVLLVSQVYDGPARPTLPNVADLRRLADIVRDPGQRQRDIRIDDLRDEFRGLHRLDPDVPVSTEDLRGLIGQVGLAKTALARQGGLVKMPRHVTHGHLEELLRSGDRVRELRRYLAAEPGADLNAQDREDLIRRLLDGLVTDSSLDAVLDLLRGSSPDDLRNLFQDGVLGQRLLSAIPIRHPLRKKLDAFAQERFDNPALPLKRWDRAWALLDRPFRPWMIDSSLPDGADVYLDEANLRSALGAANARGWTRSDPVHVIGEAVIRPLGLSQGPQGVARNWLARLAEVAERQSRIDAHFRGDLSAGLDVEQQWHEIEASLHDRSLAPWQALELLDDANDEELAEFIRRGLLGDLARKIPPGHVLYERAEGFRVKRLPGGQQVTYIPARPFDPGMISSRLDNLGVRRDLTPEQLENLGAVIAGRSRTGIAAGLALNQRRQRALFDWWWNEVGQLARLVNQVREYLDGNLDVVEDDDELPPLISRLLGSEYTQRHALQLLEALDDAQLARLFADDAALVGLFGARLSELLEQQIPPQAQNNPEHPLRPRLENLIRDRLDAGGVRAPVEPPLSFSLDMISDELADVGIRDELTSEQLVAAATALAGRSDADVTRALPPVERARRRLVRRVRAALVDWVLEYAHGKRGYGMTATQMRNVVEWLLAAPVPDRAVKAVLKLMESVDDDQLAELYDDRLGELLEQAIPPEGENRLEHELRARWETLRRDRFDAGQVKTGVQPASSFSLGMISEELQELDVPADAELGPEVVVQADVQLDLKYDLDENYTSGVSDKLAELSPAQQGQAMRVLGGLRGQVHDEQVKEGSSRPEWSSSVRALDEILPRLYADAARRITDPSDLSDLTAIPPASQAEELREALTPAAVPAADEAADDEAPPRRFTKELDGQDFDDRLRQALLRAIDKDYGLVVRGKGPAERAQPGNLYEKEHIQEVADWVIERIREVLGGFVNVPQLVVAEPGEEGNIYDQFAYQEWQWRSWSPQAHREDARRYLTTFLRGERPSEEPARVAAEHGADVSFTWPFNDETKATNDVIDRLLDDHPELVRRINEIVRGWPGRHASGTIMLSFFREAGKDVDKLWGGVAYNFIHEMIHRLRHDAFEEFATSFPGGSNSREWVTLNEGVATLLADVVWADIVARLPKTGDGDRTNLENWSRIIQRLGPDDDIPDFGDVRHKSLRHRYEALTETIGLVSRVGFENLLAAYFRGEWWKIAPDSRGSMLAPAQTAEPSSGQSSPSSPSTPSADESSSEDGPPPGAAAPVMPPAAPGGPPAAPVMPSAPSAPPGRDAATRQIDIWLAANRLKRVRVDSDGNTLYHGLIQVAGSRLSRIFGRQELSPLTLRRYVANILRHDRSTEDADRPTRYGGLIRESDGQTPAQAWDDHIAWIGTNYGYRQDAADVVPNILAFEFGLPLTLVQPGADGPLATDIGPPGHHRYVLVRHGEHYWATEPLSGRVAPEPTAVREAQVRGDIARLRKQFTWLQRRYARLSEIAPPSDTRDEVMERFGAEMRAEGYAADFELILSDERPDFSRQARADFEVQRLQRLRHEHRRWLSAVLGVFGDFAPSEDAAHLSVDELRDYQRDHLPLSGALSDSEQDTDTERSSTPATSSDESSGEDGPPPSGPAAPRPAAPRPAAPRPAAPFRDKSFAPSAPGRASVHHIEGDLLRLPEPVGAIVSPAADGLILGGGGLSGEIQSRGGERIRDEIGRKLQDFDIEGVPAGNAVETSAPNIKAQYVIHAVQPDFERAGVSSTTRELLAQTYRSALALADRLGLASVAFPVLSGGTSRGSLTPGEVEQIGLDALRGADTNVRDVYLLRYQARPRITLPSAESPVKPPPPAASSAPLARPLPRRGTPAAGGGARAAVEPLTWDAAEAQINNWLAANSLERVDVSGDGNCTYHGLIAVAGDHISRLLGEQQPEPINLRSYLVAILQHDWSLERAHEPSRYGGFIRESAGQNRQQAWEAHIGWIGNDGRYSNDAADVVPNILAFELGLPLTLVQPGADGPLVTDIGPPGDDRYVLVLHGEDYGEHYWATRPLAGRRAPRPAMENEAQVRGEINRLVEQFGWLQARYGELSASFPSVGDRETEERVSTEARTVGYALDFNQILGQQRPAGSVQPVTAFERQRLQRLQNLHRSWLSAVRRIFPYIAPSEDAADLTVGQLLAYQQEQLAPSAAPAGSGPVGSDTSPVSLPAEPGTPGATSPGPHAGALSREEREWRSQNPWWSPQRSDDRTGREGLFRPTPEQGDYLEANDLVIQWVRSDGDCSFSATAYTVPQAEIREQIRATARQWDIGVPLEEADDEVGWLLRQAADAARNSLTDADISDIVRDAARLWRIAEPPEQTDGIGWLLDRAVEQMRAAQPELGPEVPVTGQHLRLFLAYLWERDHRDWRPDPGFWYEGTSGDIPQGAQTREGMARALRRITNFADPYGTLFPYLIPDFLNLPLQVLQPDGAREIPPHSLWEIDAGAPRYTFVLTNDHYVATVLRTDAPRAAGQSQSRRDVRYQPGAWTGDVTGRKSRTLPASAAGGAAGFDVGIPALPGLLALAARRGGAEAPSTDDAGLGEFDAGLFDQQWRELVEDSARMEEVARATAQARELIGRPEPVIEVNTRTPIAELSPLGQAIRLLAFRIYNNPAAQAGAQALAQALAARLEALLGPPRQGRRPGGTRRSVTWNRPGPDAPAFGKGAGPARWPRQRPRSRSQTWPIGRRP